MTEYGRFSSNKRRTDFIIFQNGFHNFYRFKIGLLHAFFSGYFTQAYFSNGSLLFCTLMLCVRPLGAIRAALFLSSKTVISPAQ